MVKQTTKYTTEAGAIFDTEYEAWKDELRALMAVYADSDAIARRIVTAVDDGQPDTLDALARIITGMKESVLVTVVDYEPPAAVVFVTCSGCGSPRERYDNCRTADCPGF